MRQFNNCIVYGFSLFFFCITLSSCANLRNAPPCTVYHSESAEALPLNEQFVISAHPFCEARTPEQQTVYFRNHHGQPMHSLTMIDGEKLVDVGEIHLPPGPHKLMCTITTVERSTQKYAFIGKNVGTHWERDIITVKKYEYSADLVLHAGTRAGVEDLCKSISENGVLINEEIIDTSQVGKPILVHDSN